MSKLVILFFSLFGLIYTPVAQGILQEGLCDYLVDVVTQFNVTAYQGVWYDIESLPSNFQNGTCNTATYSLNSDATALIVQNTQINDGILSFVIGSATPQAGANGSAKFDVIIGGPNPVPYWVLDTDYETFALVYSCRNNTNTRTVSSWKLGRRKGPLPDEVNNRINNIIERVEALKKASDKFVKGDHSEDACSYFVDIDGPCPTVTSVPDFRVDRFLGAWYEVARYPQTTQTGQCNQAKYAASTTTGVYTVVNSQVINETRYTISGEARATTQSGVLAVTFNERVEDLYVLATDYDNYALLYSCATIAGNRRRIGSWQLRRNFDPLNEIATKDINDAIANTPNLETAFYQTTSQSSEACFYYPDFPENPDFIELPGECDTSITGVADFEVDRYLGAWYEVARYPQTAQMGQCNRAEYAKGAGFYTVVNSQVTNETRSTISGEARATIQSGVLAVTFNIGGQPRTQNLHVLATDYDSFALVYSCENNNGSRRVGSWKLSRSLEPLSDAANNIINAAISNTQGLRPDLYRETQQSEDACWYYPTQNESLPVIIPGQCDTAISGVANIDLTKFANSNAWYQISRYDPVGERSCIGNRLTLAGNYINVNSIEVIGGQANRTKGIARLSVNDTGKFDLELTDSDKVEIYVLATDYDNYAIAYTCKNESTTQRQIGVWLLSRTRNWPNAVNSTLETLINNRREITNRPGYFKYIPQSAECPEPSSAFLFRSSIIVIFVCTVLQLIW